MTLLAIFGCAPTTRATALSSVEGLIMEATIEQSTERLGAWGDGFAADHVWVALQDRDGHTLEREDLRVEMNDVPLGARNEHGNFYDRHPFYRLDDASAHLEPGRKCQFAIIRADGTHHVVGVVNTPKAVSAAQFDLPETLSRNGVVAISWNDLAEPAEMVIYRRHAFTDPAGEVLIDSGSAMDPDALRRTIGPGVFRRAGGRFEIPASFLADHDGRRVCAIGVEITVTHEGEVRDPFSRRSVLRAIRRLVFHANLTD